MARYLPFLAARADALGVAAERRRAASLGEALAACPLVVNCAGLAAGALAGDASVTPIRGQVVRTTNPGVDRVLFEDEHPGGLTYVVPRGDDCVLGGTADRGARDLTPDPATAARILARCTALEPRLAEARVLEHRVGLRPGRPTVRLDIEHREGGACIHNYGHGGAGITLSWGCADEVVALAAAVGGLNRDRR